MRSVGLFKTTGGQCLIVDILIICILLNWFAQLWQLKWIYIYIWKLVGIFIWQLTNILLNNGKYNVFVRQFTKPKPAWGVNVQFLLHCLLVLCIHATTEALQRMVNSDNDSYSFLSPAVLARNDLSLAFVWDIYTCWFLAMFSSSNLIQGFALSFEKQELEPLVLDGRPPGVAPGECPLWKNSIWLPPMLWLIAVSSW